MTEAEDRLTKEVARWKRRALCCCFCQEEFTSLESLRHHVAYCLLLKTYQQLQAYQPTKSEAEPLAQVLQEGRQASEKTGEEISNG